MQSRRVNTFEDIQQYYFDHATSLVAHSISVMIIALNEEYNFGTERLNRLLARYQKINRHLNDYQDDAKSQAEIRTKLQCVRSTSDQFQALSCFSVSGPPRTGSSC